MTVLQQAGLVAANFAVGYANDASGASAANPHGYDTMLWLFGLLSLAGFLFATLLVRRERQLQVSAASPHVEPRPIP
jgi:hypothetical protein